MFFLCGIIIVPGNNCRILPNLEESSFSVEKSRKGNSIENQSSIILQKNEDSSKFRRILP